MSSQYYNVYADEPLFLYFKHDPILCSEPHFHDSIEFIFPTKGTIHAHLEGKVQAITPGDIFFAESYETHYYETDPGETISAYVLVISGEYIHAFRSLYSTSTFPTYMRDKEKNKAIYDFVESWFQANRTQLLNYGNASVLLSMLVERYPFIPRKNYEGDIFLKQMLRYIHQHYLEDISLNTIAHDLGFSVAYCSKTLKNGLKTNFRSYVNSLRLRRAKELESDKSLSLTQSEILYQCGFNSPATYYRVKKQLESHEVNF